MVLLHLFDKSQTRLSYNARGLNEVSLPLARMLMPGIAELARAQQSGIRLNRG